jgi:hypothetical protein
MKTKITLPTELDVLAVPPLSMLSVLQTTLAMTIAAIHCEHPDLNEIPRYFADDGQLPKSMVLAQTICDRCNELDAITDLYQQAVKPFVEGIKKDHQLPF